MVMDYRRRGEASYVLVITATLYAWFTGTSWHFLPPYVRWWRLLLGSCGTSSSMGIGIVARALSHYCFSLAAPPFGEVRLELSQRMMAR